VGVQNGGKRVGNDFKDLFGDWNPDDEGMRFPEELSSDSERRPQRALNEKEVRVVNVFEATIQNPLGGPSQSNLFVLLRDKDDRKIRIFVVREMAYAISMALENETPDRPFTHDLMKTLLERLGATVDHVIIDDLLQETFYAKVIISHQGRTMEVDARPSDALALALRFRVPIYVAEAVLEAAQEE
jgi:bifunctional DNase/RNase